MVLFLLVVTSARRVSEIKALMSELPYTVFYKDKVQLRPHPAFLPKVMLHFRVNQDNFLPVFHPKPHTYNKERRLHTLDVMCALAFYLERTKPFRRSTHLFVAVADGMNRLPMLTQRISYWITICIHTCYELARLELLIPRGLRWHQPCFWPMFPSRTSEEPQRGHQYTPS